MMRYRRSMRVHAARHCRTWNRLRGPWNEFDTLEWLAGCQASRMTFHSLSTRRAFLVRPGAATGTFTGRSCLKLMSFSAPRLAQKYHKKMKRLNTSPIRLRVVIVSWYSMPTPVLRHRLPEAADTRSFIYTME